MDEVGVKRRSRLSEEVKDRMATRVCQIREKREAERAEESSYSVPKAPPEKNYVLLPCQITQIFMLDTDYKKAERSCLFNPSNK